MNFFGTVLSTGRRSLGLPAMAAILVASVLLSPRPAAAFCGLQSCPRVEAHGASHAIQAGLRSRGVAFDIGDESGFYTLLGPNVFVRLPWVTGFSLGGELTWITLHTGEYDRSGLGNALVTMQYARRLSYTWSAEVGLQWELPIGDTEHGLADDHMMLLPWVGVRKEWNPAWYTSVMAGFSQAIGGEEDNFAPGDTLASPRVAPGAQGLSKTSHNGVDHGDGTSTPTLVNPHGDREWQWRIALGRRLGDAWTVETFGLGQADVSQPGTREFYTRAGVAADWSLTPAVGLHFVADAPVSPSRRSDASLGVDVKVGW